MPANNKTWTVTAYISSYEPKKTSWLSLNIKQNSEEEQLICFSKWRLNFELSYTMHSMIMTDTIHITIRIAL